jgi:bacterioferritin-associated ferredoxin
MQSSTQSQSPAVTIDRCYCEQKTFASLIALAEQDQLDLAALASREGCGTHCGWCVAYLRRGLRTGETVFHILLDKESLFINL